MVKFGYAVENKNLSECIKILENKKESNNQGHWKTLLKMAKEQKNYFVVERCYVALKDYSRAKFVRKINTLVK